MTNKKWYWALVLAALLICLPALPTRADDWYGTAGGYYTVYDENGQVLFTRAGVIYVDDEYISGGNRLYRVTAVDDTAMKASAKFIEDVTMQMDALEIRQISVQQVASDGASNGTIALYCTHTDESYVPTDGTESKEGRGGIVDVAQQIADQLEALNYQVEFNDTNHMPHDAGAYRRSRKTAVKMMRDDPPLAMLDIHRDGVPNAEEYIGDINGEQASRVRLVVGRSNQNKDANKEFALKIKKMADQEYPGLIKDIYLGKGSYNQDLMPRALILEMGTHTVDKDLVLRSADMVADSVAFALGGAVPGESQNPAPGQNNAQNNAGQPQQPQGQPQGAQTGEQTKASFKGIGWVVGVVVAVGLIFLLVAMNSGGRGQRVGNFFRELTGTGKHKK
ncbi:MAG: stage II sporulation protein P [Eubacteriales bacterium]|nr:stage II sporulation protein P [Eubacteriales bacterium]